LQFHSGGRIQLGFEPNKSKLRKSMDLFEKK
jgi:hypothetical protein